MIADPSLFSSPAYWSRAGLVHGVRIALPGVPAMSLFGVAFGAVSAQKGLTLFEAASMSTLVFAGASQFVAVEMWTNPMTAFGVVTIGLVVATVNMRFLLMSAALRPWLGNLPTRQAYSGLALLTDPGWVLAMRYRADGGADGAVFLSSGFALWLAWIISTALGHLLGTLLTDPKRYALDLVMPIFLLVILVPLWRGPRPAAAWAVAGAVALLAAELMPGWWFIMLGAVAGSLATEILHEPA